MANALADFLTELSKSAYGWPESLRFTYEASLRVVKSGVPGDLIECGVANGVHPAAMARACDDAQQTRTIRLVDSFVGVPNGGKHDRDWNEHYGDGSGTLAPTGVSACSRDDVWANLVRWNCAYGYGEIVMHEGWFQDTLPSVADAIIGRSGSIAFLRLDGDLYDSYLTCLTHLYPLVSSGGVVVLDDWNLGGCRTAVRDFFWHSDAWGGHPDVQPITESGDVWWVKP